jgi:hypothetical protein
MPSPDVSHLLELREYHATQLQRCDDALALLRTVGHQLQRAQSMTARVKERATGQPRTRHAISALDFVRQHAVFDGRKAADEIRRVHVLATAQGLSYTPSAISSAFYMAKKVTVPVVDQSPVTSRSFAQQHGNLDAPNYGEAKRLAALAAAQGHPLTQRSFESVLRRMKRERGRGRSKFAVKSRQAREQKQRGARPIDYVREVFRSTDGPVTRDQVVDQAQLRERTRNPKFVNVSATKILEAMVRAKEIKATKEGYVAYKLQPAQASSNGAEA